MASAQLLDTLVAKPQRDIEARQQQYKTWLDQYQIGHLHVFVKQIILHSVIQNLEAV